jgi:hypothetical protein
MQDKQYLLLKSRQVGKSYVSSIDTLKHWYDLYNKENRKLDRIKSIKSIFNI